MEKLNKLRYKMHVNGTVNNGDLNNCSALCNPSRYDNEEYILPMMLESLSRCVPTAAAKHKFQVPKAFVEWPAKRKTTDP